MNALSVLHVVSSYPPAYAYGGPPRSVHNTATALAERGLDISVFTTDAKNASERVTGYENPEHLEGVTVHRFRNVSNALSWRNVPFAPGMRRALRRRIVDYDIVHTHEFRSFHTWFAHRAAKEAGVPHILQPRGSVPRGTKSRQKRLFDALAGKQLLTEADCVIASSKSEASQFEEVARVADDRVATVPNGIDVAEFDDLPDEGAFRERYGITPEAPMILFLSRLHKRKGGDLLVDAFAEIQAEYPESTLVFVGPDEGARDRLEQAVHERGLQDKTLFTGPLYGDDKLAAYRDADVFVLPSRDRYESFGNVVLESLACGTPVVVTEVCGVAEYIPEQFGEVVGVDSTEIGAGICRRLDHVAVGIQSVREFLGVNLSWSTVSQEMEHLYRDLISGRMASS